MASMMTKAHGHLAVLDYLAGAPRDHGVSDLDAGLLGLLLACGSDVYEHVLPFNHLLPLLGGQDVRGFGGDDSIYVALACADHHPLAQEHLAPPSAQGVEGEEPLLGDGGYDEPHLVRVPGHEHPRPLRSALGDEGDCAQLVHYHLVGVGLHVLLADGVHLPLEARGSEGLHHPLHEIQ
jgi:hypothetical protein